MEPIEHYKNLSLQNIVEEIDGIICVEEWKDIVGYEGWYKISSFGRVKSLKRLSSKNSHGSYRPIKEKIKPSFDDGKGYRRVELSKEGVNKKYFCHRLVGISFIPNPENKPQINHKLGKKFDNRVSQLEWATKSEDRQHALKVLKVKTGNAWKNIPSHLHPMFGRKGELSPNWGKKGKLSSNFGKTGALCKNSVPIICNETGERYEGIKEMSRIIQVSSSKISAILKGFDKNINGLTYRYENHIPEKSKRSMKTLCTTTGEVFESITDAALKLGVSPSKISLVMKGKRKQTGGYKFAKA